jgi:voltage-gated potassium channel
MRPLNLVERRLERFLREPPSVRNAVGVIVIATTLIVVGAGAAISLLDREEYPDVGVGMWWAVQTITTVGYGDVTPTHLTGRLLGAIVMLQGTAFIAIVTAVITSTFVARATRQRAEQGEASEREWLARRLDEIDRKLDRLVNSSAADG